MWFVCPYAALDLDSIIDKGQHERMESCNVDSDTPHSSTIDHVLHELKP
jgi:hypothetical protein